jgi:SAM-dependent methyltransferase
MFRDGDLFLFQEWIRPVTLDDFRGKTVLEAGCGGGQHTVLIASRANEVVAVDLNTVEIARQRAAAFDNVRLVEADIAAMDLGRRFDIVLSVGVVHHTDDPDRTVANLARHVKPGGRLILWVYSEEGNWLIAHVVEPLRRRVLRRLSRRTILALSRALCALLYVPVYSVYLLPLPFLPYDGYFENFRRLSFGRNLLNVFDKLNAPQVQLISRARLDQWFSGPEFSRHEVRPYCGVSWTAVGMVR